MLQEENVQVRVKVLAYTIDKVGTGSGSSRGELPEHVRITRMVQTRIGAQKLVSLMDVPETAQFWSDRDKGEILGLLKESLEGSKEKGLVLFGRIIETYPEEGGTEAVNLQVMGFQSEQLIVGKEQLL
ncbi:hypothetical protein B4086_5523 [Bacillus cereus]|nr:hypothetical protein B4086_5523 [Bacillus cereus]